eukprot:TRINITY_DN48697_c0_g1_i1.p1 TRINITY_DN48697_c0_g1~~TRINITY_DN48697_c0_g1_i1.p1  ORF type:complete len:1993 (+),score=289.05 TRINITY_DN48697_c0_g1_i1:23-5980(+)
MQIVTQRDWQRNRHTYVSLNVRPPGARGHRASRQGSSQFVDVDEATPEPSEHRGFWSWWPFRQRAQSSSIQERSVPEAPSRTASGIHSGLRPADQSNSDSVWPAGDRRWMPDEKCPVCFHCGVTFGAFRRRHHCRLCGQIFCHACSGNFVPGKLIGRPREHQSRLCEACTLYCDGLNVQRPGDPSSSSSSQALRQAPASFSRQVSQTPPQISPRSGRTSPRRLSAQLAGITENSLTQPDDSASVNSPSVLEEGESDEDDDEVSETDSASATRSRSATSGTNRGTIDDDMDEIIEVRDMLTDDVTTSDLWHWGDERTPLQRTVEAGSCPAASIQQHLLEEPLQSLDVSSSVSSSLAHQAAWRQMADAGFKHFVQSVRDCCEEFGNGLEDQEHVLAICKLAQQVVDHTLPGPGDSMDILDYVKVKRVPGGHIRDSLWVDGVVFSRDIAHRKMRNDIQDCHVALLREPLNFDRDDRLTRLDDLRPQEEMFIELKVDKIADDLRPKPELLLCQAGVSQMAQEKLRNKNISLVLGVPSHILDAVARCTGARVLPAVDSIVRCTAGGRNAVVGTCRSFTMKHTGEAGEEGYKPLAIIEGSRPGQFSTVCLRGGGSMLLDEALQLLTNAKRVLQWAIRLARHMQLESELLFETWCESWSHAYPARPPCSLLPGSNKVFSGHEPLSESLDIICYSVSTKEERSCSLPVVYRFPFYGFPQQQENSVHGSATSRDSLDMALDCVRDCTLREWLLACLTSDRAAMKPPVGSTSAAASAASASLVSDDVSAASAAAVAATALPAVVMPSSSASFQGAEGIHSSSAARRYMSGSCVVHDPPLPISGEVLCFQRQGNRVVVEVDRLHPRMRNTEDGTVTRWSLLTAGEGDGKHSEGQTDAGHISSAAATGHSAVSSNSVRSATADSDESACATLEMWRFCKVCGRQVTPCSALSRSAGWHSMAKFLGLLLHNNTSRCSKLAAAQLKAKDIACTHSAFRDHVLLCSSPDRPLVVSFKWEQVDLWTLSPPHPPFWEPSTGHLLPVPCTPTKPDSRDSRGTSFGPLQDGGTASTQDMLASLLRQLEDLLELIAGLIRSLLITLSCLEQDAHSDDQEDATEGSTTPKALPAPRSESVLFKTSQMSPASPKTPKTPQASTDLGATGTVSGNAPSTASGAESGKQMASEAPDLGKTSDDWLRPWIWENRAAWHRAMVHMNALHVDLSGRLKSVNAYLGRQCLGDFSAVMDADPVLASSLFRDLLDALREDGPSAASSSSSAPSSTTGRGAVLALLLRTTKDELAALRKIKDAPGEDKKVISFPMVPLPNALSNFASSAKETLKRFWPSEEVVSNDLDLNVPLFSSQPQRSRSVCGQRSRGSLSDASCYHQRRGGSGERNREPQHRSAVPRSRTVEGHRLRGGLNKTSRRHDSSLKPNMIQEAEVVAALPSYLQRVIQALGKVAEDSNRCALLERGVHGICLSVHEDDVGSVIAHALLSHQANEQMQAQWASVSGGKPHCPLAEEGKGCSCFASLPPALDSCKRCSSQRPSSDRGSRGSWWIEAAPSVATDSAGPEDSRGSHDAIGTTEGSQAVPGVPIAGSHHPADKQIYSDRQPRSPRLRGLTALPWKWLPGHSLSEDAQMPSCRPWEEAWEQRGVRSVLTAATPSEPVRVDFADKHAQYSVNIYHAPQYHVLRHLVCGDDLNFVRSLHYCNRITPSGGKTRAAFFVSQDRRFLLKAVNRAEFKMLRTQAEPFFWYADQVLFEKLPSVLIQVLGLFTVSITLREKSRASRGYFVVQRNLRFSLQSQPHFVFDLKGVGKSRRVPGMPLQVPEEIDAEEGAGNNAEPYSPKPEGRRSAEPATKTVLWDQNFREWTEGKPLCMVASDLRYVEAAVFNDTQLLSKQCLMDYSLLLAAVPAETSDSVSQSAERGSPEIQAPGRLCLGIIDYLRPYTWDKQVETAWKSLAQNSSDQPTVIEPDNYAGRFLRAMSTYFVADCPPQRVTGQS